MLKTASKAQKPISVGILSLGCPKTLVDSELALGRLDSARFSVTSDISHCDVAVLNTCSFIQEAKQESIDKIIELVELKKAGQIKGLVVLGCLFQRYSKTLQKEFKEVDAFVGTGEYDKIESVFSELARRKKIYRTNTKPIIALGSPGYVYSAENSRVALTPVHFRYVKISEGCDHICTFCSIPSFRGKHRSRPVSDIVKEIEKLAAEGAKEVILTGQDTSFYGRDLTGKYILPELLNELNSIRGIKWIRVLYLYPSCVNLSMIQAIAKLPKVCNYLDMPLQHISDPMLLAMKRGVTKERTLRLVEQIRKEVPGVAIRTTFIVGFPGETDRDFNELLEFMHETKFERLGVFQYSQEDGTPAGVMKNQIPEKVKQERFKQAMQLQQKISLENNQKWIGRELDILVDGASQDYPNMFQGRSQMDAPDVDGIVYLRPSSKTKKLNLKPGDFVKAKVAAANEYDLTADLIS